MAPSAATPPPAGGPANQFLTRSPAGSPPVPPFPPSPADLPTSPSASASASGAALDKPAAIKRAVTQLTRVGTKYNMLFDEYRLDSSSGDGALRENAKLVTGLLDEAIRGRGGTREDVEGG